jgi:hypothetical protein
MARQVSGISGISAAASLRRGINFGATCLNGYPFANRYGENVFIE